MTYKHGDTDIGMLLGKESTPGTEAGTISTTLGLLQDISVKTGYRPVDINSSASQDRRHSRAGMSVAEVSADYIVQDFRSLYYIMGGHAVSGTGPYTHTLSQSNTLPSSTLEVMAGSLSHSRKILGAKANSLDMHLVPGEPLRSKLDFVGMDWIKETTPQTYTESTSDPWMFDEATIFTINGVSKLDVSPDVTVSCNRNVEAVPGVGSKAAAFAKEGKRPWEIQVDEYMDDSEILDIVANETSFAVQLKFVKSAGTNEATLTFNQCKIHEPGQDLPGDNALKESFTILPYAKSGQTLMTASVIDSIADYSSY